MGSEEITPSSRQRGRHGVRVGIKRGGEEKKGQTKPRHVNILSVRADRPRQEITLRAVKQQSVVYVVWLSDRI